MHRTAIYTAVG